MFLHACIQIHCMCVWCPRRPEEEGIRSLQTAVAYGWELPSRCWEPKPILKQEQHMLLTAEPSLSSTKMSNCEGTHRFPHLSVGYHKRDGTLGRDARTLWHFSEDGGSCPSEVMLLGLLGSTQVAAGCLWNCNQKGKVISLRNTDACARGTASMVKTALTASSYL